MGKVGERPGGDAPGEQDIPQNKGHEPQAGRLPGTKAKTFPQAHTALCPWDSGNKGISETSREEMQVRRQGSTVRMASDASTAMLDGHQEMMGGNLHTLKDNDFQLRLQNSRQGQGRT